MQFPEDCCILLRCVAGRQIRGPRLQQFQRRKDPVAKCKHVWGVDHKFDSPRLYTIQNHSPPLHFVRLAKLISKGIVTPRKQFLLQVPGLDQRSAWAPAAHDDLFTHLMERLSVSPQFDTFFLPYIAKQAVTVS